jgi:hypothetical protein
MLKPLDKCRINGKKKENKEKKKGRDKEKEEKNCRKK